MGYNYSMITSDQVIPLKEILTPAQSILVILAPDATFDQIAAATALYFSLQAAGKQVSLVSPSEVSRVQPMGRQVLQGVEVIQTKLGNKDLSVSFDYVPEAVDKVSYHIDEETQRFHLIIKPQRGSPPLDEKSVQFEYTGAEADILFLIGVHSLESLEHLYFGYEQLYQNTTSIVLHSFEPSIGNIKLSTGDMSCLSEGMSGFLQYSDLPIPSEAATNLLVAIEEVTDGFQSLTTTAETFEKVAFLLRNGARRSKKMPQEKPQVQINSQKVQLNGPTVQNNLKPSKKNGFVPSSKKKVGDLSHQPSDFTVGARG